MDQYKILIVGSGGIGCELLKNVVLSDFKFIHIVDLDTIELSNLNRQFLFRKHHIGRSKALMAKEAALKIARENGQAEPLIEAHFANIMDTKLFPLTYFKGFDLILNALDNVAARRHVNNMCLAVKVPLIESGTAGYFGQACIIWPGRTECFDCIPKETPKTFPVCTIRSTPSALIHCIVWAKDFLLERLFGQSTDSNSVLENATESPAELAETWMQEEQAFQRLIAIKDESFDAFYHAMFDKVFNADICNILSIEELWKSRAKPAPLCFRKAPKFDADTVEDHELWTLDQWLSVFNDSCQRLAARKGAEIVFDKDDLDTLNFVSAAASIRAHIFAIPMESRFDIKAKAGNIIPAIATTNAVAAGIMLVHAYNVLANVAEAQCNAYIAYGSRDKVFNREELCPPNPSCKSCSVDRAILDCNLDSTLISFILETLLPNRLEMLRKTFADEILSQFQDEDVMITEGSRLLFDGFDDDGHVRSRPLSAFGVRDSQFLMITVTGYRPLLLGVVHNPSLTVPCISWDLKRPLDSAGAENDDAPCGDTQPDARDSESELVMIDTEVEIVNETVKRARLDPDNK